MRLRNELLPLFLLALETSPLMGVGTTGTIVGMVTDTLGALVANAKVTVLNQGTGGSGKLLPTLEANMPYRYCPLRFIR